MPAQAMEDLTSTQIATKLLAAVKGGECIAWVGAGLSKLAYADWGCAVRDLCSACGVQGFGTSQRAPTAEQLTDKAEECKQANGNAYEATLAKLYGGKVVETRQAYLWLISAPFRGYVTTNFDPLLSEAAAAFSHNNIFRYPILVPRDIELHAKPLFYIHGHARPGGVPNGQNLVLARSEFNEAYQGVVAVFVQALLLSYPIVFIGCSLSEPEIHEQIRRVHSMHIQMKKSRSDFKAPPRFALLPTIFRETTIEEPGPGRRERNDEAENAEARRFRELDTEVLRYHPTDRMKHWEIEDILKALCDLAREMPKVGPGEAMPR